ncbi:Homeobox-leucine zipper protein hox32 [Lathyrus oleraceus]|uniref:Homeobox-leucine zipper protein hox32 n=1 Tax=Pisum sativum TaxID=3888 RepID=A0A9D4XLE2_PEA|nr:Homeobox-leucine zipper protein hox32 [Pisum sativum]
MNRTDKTSNSLHKKENIPVLARWNMLGNANPSSSDGSSCDYGIDENSIGACAQLVFAPIDESFADDALLLPSGFRDIPLDPKSDVPATSRTLDLASTLEVGSSNARAVGEVGDAYNLRSVLTIAFQFTFENHLRDNVAGIFRGEPEFRENEIYT